MSRMTARERYLRARVTNAVIGLVALLFVGVALGWRWVALLAAIDSCVNGAIYTWCDWREANAEKHRGGDDQGTDR